MNSNNNMIELQMELPIEHEKKVFGQFDEHIKKIERTLQVTLISRDGVLKIVGPAPNVQKAESIIRELLGLSVRGNTIQSQNVDYALSLTMEEKEASPKQEAEVFGEDVLDQYLVKESYERILQAIRKLDEIYRVVFEFKYLHELSDKEIADLLGVTPKVVNVRIFRARKKLQNLLREE